MTNRLAARAVTGLTFGLSRIRRDDRGQATVEYAGLAMAVGVLLLAVGSFLGGKRQPTVLQANRGGPRRLGHTQATPARRYSSIRTWL